MKSHLPPKTFSQNYFIAILLALGMISNLSAKTVVWWRGNMDGPTLVNKSEVGSEFDAFGSPLAASTEEISAPFIFDPVNKEYYSNDASFLSGVDNYISTKLEPNATLAKLLSQSSFTIEAIVKTDNSHGGYQLIFGNSSSEEDGFALATSADNHFRFYAHQLADDFLTEAKGDIAPENEWFSVAVVAGWNGSDTDVKFYMNGNLVDQKVFVGGLKVKEETVFEIGTRNPWNGPIDEIRISDQALEPEQFLQSAAQKKSP